MAKLSPDQLEQYNAAFNELESSETISTQLPNLQYEKGKLAELWERFRNWWDGLFDFKGDPSQPWDWSWISPVIQIVFYLTVAVLLGLVLYRLWLYWKNRPSVVLAAQALSSSPGAFIGREESMAEAIEQALGLKEFHRACRLRWKLFLKRFRENPFLTPLEWQRRRTSTKTQEGLWPNDPNEMMFGGRPQGLQDYQSFDEYLTRLETKFLT